VVAVEVDLAGATSAPQAARSALRSLCADQIHGDLLLDAELLIGELATNALIDGRRRVILIAHLADDHLFVEVIEEVPGVDPDRREKDPQPVAAGGGLDVVDDLSSRWGVHDGTTHVWFELQR